MDSFMSRILEADTGLDTLITLIRRGFLVVSTSALTFFILRKFWPIRKRKRSKKQDYAAALEERKPAVVWNTALFFPDYHADELDSTTQQFLWYFQQARTSIRVCIYNFSFPELEYVIFEQYKRGLIVHFVVGYDTTAEKLRAGHVRCGVFPRDPSLPATDQLMHHKFALIDDEAVLTGSMNWTTEGIVNNNENICVSTNPKIVDMYLKEFFRLMSCCEKAKTFY